MDDVMDLLIGGTNNELPEIIKSNLDDRRILLDGAINDSALQDVMLYILKWNKEDKDKPKEKCKPIYLYLNNYGGDIVIGLNMIDLIKTSHVPIYAVVFGRAYSMACLILASCHKRYCLPNSVVLMHDGNTGYQGSTGKAKDFNKFTEKIEEIVKDLIVEKTNIISEYYDEIYEREMYMFGSGKAKELGFIDCVIGEDVSLLEIL